MFSRRPGGYKTGLGVVQITHNDLISLGGVTVENARPETEGFDYSEMVLFNVLEVTDTHIVMEFWHEYEEDEFFDALREAGYQGENGSLRVFLTGDFEQGRPERFYKKQFADIEWSPSTDPAGDIAVDGKIESVCEV